MPHAVDRLNSCEKELSSLLNTFIIEHSNIHDLLSIPTLHTNTIKSYRLILLLLDLFSWGIFFDACVYSGHFGQSGFIVFWFFHRFVVVFFLFAFVVFRIVTVTRINS